MDLQSSWKGLPSLVWRPFQLAFVLQCIPSIVDENHVDRNTCDVLWFPTAGGKTEAYLGIAIFTLAYRRRLTSNQKILEAGTSIISRYTLRLLTIQQFRRALIAITAAEYLRTTNWRPSGYGDRENDMWGLIRFSLGLWVGGNVTPNELMDYTFFNRNTMRDEIRPGAVGILQGRIATSGFFGPDESEPAQVLECPSCKEILSVSRTNLQAGKNTIHWIVHSPARPSLSAVAISNNRACRREHCRNRSSKH